MAAALVAVREGGLGYHARLSSSCQQIRHLHGYGSRLRQFLDVSSGGWGLSLGTARTGGGRSQALCSAPLIPPLGPDPAMWDSLVGSAEAPLLFGSVHIW